MVSPGDNELTIKVLPDLAKYRWTIWIMSSNRLNLFEKNFEEHSNFVDGNEPGDGVLSAGTDIYLWDRYFNG